MRPGAQSGVAASVIRIALLALFTVSGFAGLIYESIWSHYLKLFLGHAAYAQTLVLVIFMGGMALGAALVGRLSATLRNLLLGYVVVEAVIGVMGLAFHGASVAATAWAFDTVIPALGSPGAIMAFKWSLGALLILPQSVLLGMTFPLMSGAIVRQQPQRSGQTLALLYFTNSLGAAIGVLVSGFVLIGEIGLPGTIRTAAALNLLLAAAVWAIARHAGNPPPVSPVAPAATADSQLGALRRIVLAGACATGAAAFIYEIAWMRMLAMVLGSSTHAFELMLSAFILGIALGGLWVKGRIARLANPRGFLGGVLLLMASVALGTLWLYNASFEWMAVVYEMFSRTVSGYVGYHLGSHAIAMVLMVPTTFFCGMTLPVMTHMLLRAGGSEQSIGAVYAWNTLGSIIGIVLAVHLIMPLVGVKGLMVAGAAIHATLGLVYLRRDLQAAQPSRAAVGLVGVTGLAFLATTLLLQLDPRRMASGVFRHGQSSMLQEEEVLYFGHGKTASISLTRSGTLTSIATNGKPDAALEPLSAGTSTDESTMVLIGAMPLAAHPAPRQVAVIGLGSGLSSHVLLSDPAVEAVHTIEIEPLMARAARLGFMDRAGRTFEDPRSHLHFEDAKTFFASTGRRYDVIVSEPSNPWVSGVASLFSEEFYAQVIRHLQPDGLFVQWLHIYESDATIVQSVLRALASHFADFVVYAANDVDIVIMAVPHGEAPVMGERIFQIPGLREQLARVHVTGLQDLEARFLGNRDLLMPSVLRSGVPANSDYHPYVDQRAIRARIMERTAIDITRAGMEPTAMMDLLRLRPAPFFPTTLHDPGLTRFENMARHASEMARAASSGDTTGLPVDSVRDIVLLSTPESGCRRSGVTQAWLDAVWRIARISTPTLGAPQLRELWSSLARQPCVLVLTDDERLWLQFMQATALRDAFQVRNLGNQLLEGEYVFQSREELGYAAQATISAALGLGDGPGARKVMEAHRDAMFAGGASGWVMEVLEGLVAAAAVAAD